MSKKTTGFTLIELLVVIAIIGILASIVVVAVQEARKIARDTKRKSDLKTVQNALESYYYKNKNQYVTGSGVSATFFSPYDLNCSSVPPNPPRPAPPYWGCNTAPNGGYWDKLSKALDPSYLESLPTDPTNKRDTAYPSYILNRGPVYALGYVYCTTDGKGYVLGTNLEKVTNPTTFKKYGNYQLKGGDVQTTCQL